MKNKQLSTLQRIRLIKRFLSNVEGLSYEVVSNYEQQLNTLIDERKKEVAQIKRIKNVLCNV